MFAVLENSLRPSRDKRWATGGQLPSLIRRRPPEADVDDVVCTVRWLTDVATSVADERCRGCSSRRAGWRRASRRHTCGVDGVAGRVASRRRTRRPSDRDGVPASSSVPSTFISTCHRSPWNRLIGWVLGSGKHENVRICRACARRYIYIYIFEINSNLLSYLYHLYLFENE